MLPTPAKMIVRKSSTALIYVHEFAEIKKPKLAFKKV